MSDDRRKKITFITTGLFILTAAFIFFMSSKDADSSMGDSLVFDRLLAKLFVPGYADMNENEQYLAVIAFDEPVRHVAHFLEFTVLGVLLAAIAKLKEYPLYLALGAGALYGIFDEFHQLYVAGRGCQIEDMCFDIMGVAAGTLIVWLFVRLRKGPGKPQ